MTNCRPCFNLNTTIPLLLTDTNLQLVPCADTHVVRYNMDEATTSIIITTRIGVRRSSIFRRQNSETRKELEKMEKTTTTTTQNATLPSGEFVKLDFVGNRFPFMRHLSNRFICVVEWHQFSTSISSLHCANQPQTQ